MTHEDLYKGWWSDQIRRMAWGLDPAFRKKNQRLLGYRPHKPGLFTLGEVDEKDMPPGMFFTEYVNQQPWAIHFNPDAPIEQMIETKTITREEMKRKLALGQFKKRLTPPPPSLLAALLEQYAEDIEAGRNEANILLTEIPLRLTETRNEKDDPELEAIVLAGYRIYQVKRSNPNHPQLAAIYSKLTRVWHRVGYADHMDGALGGRQAYTTNGCYTLGEEDWAKTPQPVEDNVLRRAMLVDRVSEFPGVNGYRLSRVAESRDPYNLRGLCGVTKEEAGEIPDHLLLLRFLRSKPAAYAAMLSLVDEWGMPDGILGDVFSHADRFRTF